ncbi:unnamed protein product, partial [Meganyctiphanes norvegica]
MMVNSWIYVLGIILIKGAWGLHTGPQLVSEPPALVSYPANRGTSLTCTAHGTPTPTITWVTGVGVRVEPIVGLRSIVATPGNSTLTLMPFTPHQYRHDIHHRQYRCVAGNSVGKVISRTSTVTAVVVQGMEVGVADVVGEVGGTAVLKCDVASTQAAHVTVKAWHIDGRMITPALKPDGRYWVLPTGELVVKNLTPSDAYSRISCATTHTLSPDTSTTSSKPARIMLQGSRRLSRPQVLLRQHQKLQPTVGTSLVLPCIATGHPTPYTSWRMDGGVGIRGEVMEGNLVFRTVASHDAGAYTCTANNSQGLDTYTVTMEPQSSLTVSVTPGSQRVDMGGSATLRCQVTGTPVDAITWYKDAHPLQPSSSVAVYDRTLHITKVGRSEAGMYQCMASNQKDAAQAAAQVDLGDSAPVWEYRFISQTLQPGPSVSLKCTAAGAPTPQITWKLDGYPLPDHPRLQVGQYVGMDGSVVSHLNLSSTRVEDGGSYSCMAGNQAGTIMHQARLNIYGPAWVRPMGVVTAVAGETLYLVCPVAGHPITNITWEKDSRHVTSDGHQRVLANGTLVISAVQRNTDGGSYSCTATDAHGRQHQSTATLRVMVPPTILSFNMGEVNAGMRIQVLCSAQGGDLPMNITWLKDGHHLNSNLMDGLTIKTLDQYSKILLLSELQGHHSGNYSCQASNAAKTVETSAVLVVRVPPTWVTSPHDLAATVGSSVVIPCHAEGFPKPRITWRKNTKVDSDNYRSIGGVQVSSNGSLVLPNIQHIDEGRYLCEADNSVGPPLRATVSLSVNAPPKFDQSLQQIMSVRRGSSATLACLANGDPPITLNWQAAHTTVQKHSTVREISGGVRGELVLSSVSNSDAGSFTCSASNMHGSDTFTIMLQVQ